MSRARFRRISWLWDDRPEPIYLDLGPDHSMHMTMLDPRVIERRKAIKRALRGPFAITVAGGALAGVIGGLILKALGAL